MAHLEIGVRRRMERRPAVAGRPQRRRDARSAAGFLLPNALGFLVFTLVPIVASLAISFFDWPLTSTPHFVGIDNFARLFTRDPVFARVLLNTLYFVAVYVPCNLVISLGLAVWLDSRVRGADVFRVLLFMPVVTPMVANAMVWTLIYVPGGFLGWFVGALHLPSANWLGSDQWAMPAVIAMSLWAGFGYNMLIFTAGLRGIPEALYDAASIDGANRWQQFWRVTLPMLTPTVFFGLVMTLITSFQVFTQPYVLTQGGPGNDTATLVFYLFDRGFRAFQMGYASAIAWVVFVLIMLVTSAQFLFQRRWVNYDA